MGREVRLIYDMLCHKTHTMSTNSSNKKEKKKKENNLFRAEENLYP